MRSFFQPICAISSKFPPFALPIGATEFFRTGNNYGQNVGELWHDSARLDHSGYGSLPPNAAISGDVVGGIMFTSIPLIPASPLANPPCSPVARFSCRPPPPISPTTTGPVWTPRRTVSWMMTHTRRAVWHIPRKIWPVGLPRAHSEGRRGRVWCRILRRIWPCRSSGAGIADTAWGSPFHAIQAPILQMATRAPVWIVSIVALLDTAHKDAFQGVPGTFSEVAFPS
jgi:hypothetical protein